MANHFIDLTGNKYGRLLVIKHNGKNNGGVSTWECVCDCGNTKIADSGNLKRGCIRSCGCLRVENATRTIEINSNPSKHDMTGSPEYRSWQSMKKRCYSPNDKYYHVYGGKGVKVCDRWLQGFNNFIQDMGLKPSTGHSLDRYPDNTGDYGPENCRWATMKQQQNNRTNNHILEHDGVVMNIPNGRLSLE